MSHHESSATGADSRMVDRMLFFSDAVFAIVLTILVLELRPPEAHVADERELLSGILAMGRHFASFVISFAIAGGFWIVHMRIARILRMFDWPVAVSNLVHLFTITLLPFAAALLGQHIGSPVAYSAYAIAIILVAFSSATFWLVATRDNGRLVGGIEQRRRIAVAMYIAAIGIAFLVGLPLTLLGAPAVGRLSWLLIFPILFVARRIGGSPGATSR